ncbi:MAG: hypothetical protein IH936_16125 [Acidobacteria bacterium]|nr:hypothetical protein [Acidobacteriota bacterium]
MAARAQPPELAGEGDEELGALAVLAGLLDGGRLATPLALAAIVGVSFIYLALALRFWFYIPVVGIGLATACFAGALAHSLLAG